MRCRNGLSCVELFKARSLQCGFWLRKSLILISILLWIFAWVFPPVSKGRRCPKNHQKSPTKFTRKSVQKNSPQISAEAFSCELFGASLCHHHVACYVFVSLLVIQRQRPWTDAWMDDTSLDVTTSCLNENHCYRSLLLQFCVEERRRSSEEANCSSSCHEVSTILSNLYKS